jgi:hypothetical protein
MFKPMLRRYGKERESTIEVACAYGQDVILRKPVAFATFAIALLRRFDLSETFLCDRDTNLWELC